MSNLFKLDKIQNKTLWDWLELLIIPFCLLLLSCLMTYTMDNLQKKELNEQKENELLKSYFSDMTSLMMNPIYKTLIETTLSDNNANEIQQITSARTLVALDTVSPERRSKIMNFLSDAGLIDNIPLKRANLTETNLKYLWLKNGNFHSANLNKADLTGANLKGAKLYFIKYEGTIFNDATYNECTKFPEKFNAEDKRMIYQERTKKEIDIEGKQCKYE